MTLPQPLGDALLDFIDGDIAEARAARAAAAVALGDARPAAEEQGRLDRTAERIRGNGYSGLMPAMRA